MTDIDDQESFTELAVKGETLHTSRAVAGGSLTAAHGLAHLARAVDSSYALGSPEQAAVVLDAAHDIVVSLERVVQGTRRWLAAAGDRGEVTGHFEQVFGKLRTAQEAVAEVPQVLGEAAEEVRALIGQLPSGWGIQRQAARVAKRLKERGATLLLEYVQDTPNMLQIWQIQFRVPGDGHIFEIVHSDDEFGSMTDFDVHPGAVVESVLSRLDAFVLEDAPQQIHDLSEDERTLLKHIDGAGSPVEASSFFALMNAETGERATGRQIELFQVYVSLWKRNLILAAVPANGSEADKMVLTGSGQASLNAAKGL